MATVMANTVHLEYLEFKARVAVFQTKHIMFIVC